MANNLYDAALRSLHADRQLVFEFSAIFSRLEYAAKKCGYRRGPEDKCFAAWKRLRGELEPHDEAYGSHEVQQSIEYLVHHPPRSLNQQMEWIEVPLDGDTDLARALDASVRVRNNLFHGRKGDDEDRNNRLLRECLVLIAAILKERRDIRGAYHAPI